MMSRFAPQTYAFLRIIAGLLFATHGSQKLLGWPGQPLDHLPPLLLVAASIELVGGLLIALGLFASFAAFILSGEMAVAYFMAHASGMEPGREQGRARGPLLLPLPLRRRPGKRDLERRRSAEAGRGRRSVTFPRRQPPSSTRNPAAAQASSPPASGRTAVNPRSIRWRAARAAEASFGHVQ